MAPTKRRTDRDMVMVAEMFINCKPNENNQHNIQGIYTVFSRTDSGE